MKALLSVGVAVLLLGGCAAPPKVEESGFFKVNLAGVGWKKDKTATAVFDLSVSGHAPRPLYVEAALPTPGGAPEKIKQTLSAMDSVVRFKGTPQAGWRSGTFYVFRLSAYRDPGYTELVGSVEQRSMCTRPADSVLNQLRDE